MVYRHYRSPQQRLEEDWPEHTEAFKYARGEGALLVVRQVQTLIEVQDRLLRGAGNPPFGSGLRTGIAWALRDAVDELNRDRFWTRLSIVRSIAPLLKAGRSPNVIREYAATVDADDLLSWAELTALINQEVAWWSGCHVRHRVCYGS